MMAPPRFILRFFSRIHVAVFRRTNGLKRSRMNGLPVLLLTTTGRRSGRPHTVPVVYLADEDGCLIAPAVVPRPSWYLNLKKWPLAQIQIGARIMAVEAEELTGRARASRWTSLPDYWKDYERRAGVELPLMRLRKMEAKG